MRRVLLGLLSVFIILVVAHGHGAGNDAATGPNWANPPNVTVQQGGSTTASQNTSNFLPNLDCQLISFRYVASADMTSGCFTEMAFGMMDADSSTAIFNDTDEGIRIIPFASNDGLIPWPRSSNAISLNTVSTGGTYANIYKNPFNSVQDQRNLLGQLISKKINQPADVPIRDNLGNRVVLNPQTIGFSSDGSWLVAETLTGSFIRVNLATLDVVPFAKSYGSTGSPVLLKTYISITDNGRFVALYNNEAGEFRIFDLDGCAGNVSGTKPLACPSYDFMPKIKQVVSSVNFITRVRFVMDDLISFDLTSTIDSKSGSWLIAPSDNIDFRSNYLAFGDSYTSGEGAFDYVLGSDAEVNMCHLSSRSYPFLITDSLFGQNSGHSVACSGAVIRDVGSMSENYRGQVKDIVDFKSLKSAQPSLLETVFTNHLPGYIAQHRFINRDRPRIITVSVGGNDIGFGAMLQNCVMPKLRPGTSNDCYKSLEDQLEIEQLIQRTEHKWTALFKQLSEESAGATVFAVGYPSVANPEGKCALNVHLSRQELILTENIISFLNDAIKRSASSGGVKYIDISSALNGHRFCEASPSQTAMNGLTAGKDAGIKGLKFFGKESYHPNALGHRLIAEAILKNSRNFTISSPTSADTERIATGANSGRTVYKVLPKSNLFPPTVSRGSNVEISSIEQLQLNPNARFLVHLDSSSGPTIGMVTTNVSGEFTGSFTLPAETTGGHMVHIVGPDILDKPTDIVQPIYIPSSDNDADADSLDDTVDTCPSAPNSGVDNDSDGADDVCTSANTTSTQGFSESSAQTKKALSKTEVRQNGNITNTSAISKNNHKQSGRTKYVSKASLHSVSSQNSAPQLLGDSANWQSLPNINWLKILIFVYVFIIFGYSTWRAWNKIYARLSQ